MALAAAAATLVLGFLAFLAWPKMQQSTAGSGGAPGQPFMTGGGAANLATRSAEAPSNSRAAGNQLPGPQDEASPVRSQGTATTANLPVDRVQRTTGTASTGQGNEKQAQATLDAFLSEYCTKRSSQIGHAVKPTTVTWWPMGAGVIVELDEGGDYRQGTAQFAPKNGWVWLIRPDSVALNN